MWLLSFAVASFTAAVEEAARVSYRWEEATLGEPAPAATGVAHARCCAVGRGVVAPAARRAAIRRRWGWLAHHHVGREGEGGGEGGGKREEGGLRWPEERWPSPSPSGHRGPGRRCLGREREREDGRDAGFLVERRSGSRGIYLFL